MQIQCVHTRQVTMVVPDNLVRLKIPAFDHLFNATQPQDEQTLTYKRTLSSPAENKYGCLGLTANPLTVEICPVKLSFNSPLAKSQTCKHILSTPARRPDHRQQAYLDYTISSSRHEPFVSRLNSHTPHPPKMSTNHAHQLPWRVVIWLHLTRGLSAG